MVINILFDEGLLSLFIIEKLVENLNLKYMEIEILIIVVIGLKEMILKIFILYLIVDFGEQIYVDVVLCIGVKV